MFLFSLLAFHLFSLFVYQHFVYYMSVTLKKCICATLISLSFLKLYFNFGNFLAIYSSNFCCTSLSLFLSRYTDDSLLFIIHNAWILCFYFIYCYFLLLTSLVAQTVKCLPTIWETWVQSLGWDNLLEKAMATHSSILAWKIPLTEEPGR